MKKIILPLALSAMLLASCNGGETSSESKADSKESEVSSSVSSASDGKTEYVFEAEYNPDIENMSGPAFSGKYTGLDMIQNDTKNKDYKASNGYYVTGLWKANQTLTFTVNAAAAVSNCTFIIRVSSEVYNITLKPNFYDIYVNNEAINYKEIKITDVPGYQQGCKAFEDYTLTSRLSLKAGANSITFLTNNKTAMGGTMTATAPMLDCFKIKSEVELTWDPMLSNLDDK